MIKMDGEKAKAFVLPILIIGVLTCVFYAPQIIDGRPLFSTNLYQFLPWQTHATEQELQQPVNSTLSDPLVYFFPMYAYVQDCIKNSVLPTWNPYLLCGYPLIADGTTGFFYPLRWIFLTLDSSQALALAAILRLFLAGLFMFLYLRQINIGQRASLFGAVCFMFNGFFIVWNEFPTLVESALWLPLMFLLVEKIIRKGEWRFLLLLALIMSMSILAGMFQIALYNIYATGLYALWRGITERRRLQGRGLRILFSGFGAAVAIAIVLSAVQILPFYELISNTHRRSADLQKEFYPTVCPLEFLVQYAMPEFFGTHTEHDFWFLGMAQHMNEDLRSNVAWSSNLAELNGYTGVLVLFLALIGFTTRNKSLLWFFMLLAIISRLPIFSKTMLTVYYYSVPGFKTSWAGRLSFLYMFSLISLAALGLDQATSSVMEEGFEKKYRWVTRTCCYLIAFSALFLLIAWYFRRFDTAELSNALVRDTGLPRRLAGYHIGILAAAYFWSHTVRTVTVFIGLTGSFALMFFLLRKRKISPKLFGYAAIGLAAAELFYFHFRFHPIQQSNPYFKTEAIEFIEENLGSNRIARFGNMGVLAFDTGLYFGLRDSQGYLPLIIDRVSDFLKLLDQNSVLHERWATSFKDPQSLESRLLDLLSVKYLLTDLDTDLKSERFRQVFEGGIRIYENKDAFPRGFFVTEYEVASSKTEALTALSNPGLDLRKTVILEEVPAETIRDSAPQLTADVKIIRERPNEVDIVLDAPSDGFLVLCDTFFPGWIAHVDGVEKKIYRANYIFRAVYVPAGHHTVKFQYRPYSLIVGATISGIMLFAILSVLTISFFFRRNPAADSEQEEPVFSGQEKIVLSK